MRLILALLMMLGLAGAANATCTTSAQSLTFASGSTYDVKASSVANISGKAGLSCTGSVLNILGASYAKATMTSLNGFVLKSSTGGSIPFQVAADSGFTVPFTQGGTVNYMSATLLSLLNILNPNSFAPPLYAKLTGAPNIPAGTYTDTLTIQWSYQVCNGVDALGVACIGYETGTGTSNVTVTLVVSADCRISAPNVSFGTAPLASQFQAVSQAVLVDCSQGSAYKVSFSSGGNGSSRPWRTMSDGAGHTLQYNIYRTDGTTIWDETNPLQSTANGGVGSGSTTPNQMQSYVAKVNAAQTTPPAGTYTDTVNVIISF
ncbi:spore coat protein U domain-containing protein [Sphingomonas sp. CGMCC 1.13654]|uniref:Spore coat protein U domain-containing protein n=1 Tax=Sphingomonas chungangi TaxID=2683589 RepID=A0A838L7T8_9SPHN|nr:spore coat protein U domain-containing protein [Sphingomonas chungangi]MBA2934772.1 spore coat protein U domain-containing protein [Sphingomonas chungangi]MVW58083.1 fimbrial major subunit CsuA/B family protein [Sphingomonas chungangi]